jgi:hypothetical protein
MRGGGWPPLSPQEVMVVGRVVPVLAALAATLFAAVGLLVVLTYAQPAEATFPGQNGKIVYSGTGHNGVSLFTINPDDSGRTRIYTSTRNESGPHSRAA